MAGRGYRASPAIRSSEAQSRRAQAPRPGAGPRGTYRPRNSSLFVAPEPVEFDGFSFYRSEALQCVAGEKYPIPEDSPERDYFTSKLLNVLIAGNADASFTTPLLLSKMVQAIGDTGPEDSDLQEILILRTIEYDQLVKKTTVDISQRDPPANDSTYVPATEFECFDAEVRTGSKTTTKHFVQAPESEGGWFAEITGDRSLRFKVVLEFEVKIDYNKDEDGDGPYGAQHSPRLDPRASLALSHGFYHPS